MKLIRKFNKPIAILLAVVMLSEIVSPTLVYGITGHDSMPEYRSFEPVATTNMVNMFDGGFTYNIPLIDVPNGYPINLAYHSGDVNNEELASWVGLGWNINPGTINRIKRGFPDEFNNKEVTYHNKMEKNWTIGSGINLSPEVFGDEDLIALNLGASVRYNNYKGIGTSVTAGIGFAGVANMNFSYAQGRFGFNPEINPLELLNVPGKLRDRKERKSAEQGFANEEKKVTKFSKVIQNLAMAHNKLKQKTPIGISFGGVTVGDQPRGSFFNIKINTPTTYPSTLAKYTGFMASINVDVGVNILPMPIDVEAQLNANYSQQINEESVTLQAYGYQYNEEANSSNAIMDYTTENEKPFVKRDNMIGYPLPNNDIYTLSGEALGGSFRSFRGDYGHYKKNEVYSDDILVDIGADVSLASHIPIPPMIVNEEYTVGGDIGGSYHWTKLKPWDQTGGHNFSGTFGSSNEKTFYRFSGDKAGYFEQSNDNMVYGDLNGSWSPTVSFNSGASINGSLINSGIIDSRAIGKNKKRSTFINSHTKNDFNTVSNIGIRYKMYEKKLFYRNGAGGSWTQYDYNDLINESNTEMVTYNNDGVTYVYGLPVLSKNQLEMQYSLESNQYNFTNSSNSHLYENDLVANVTSNSVNTSSRRKLGFESPTPTPTTHLITQILGPDYVDRTANGATADDFGSFTRFNYTRVAGGGDWYAYRSPYQGVNFNYGSLSSNKDDMGSFSYGEKEIYYMESVVSKTHVAIFTLEDRVDGQGAPLEGPILGADKVSGNGTVQKNSLKRLKRIDLYPLSECDAVPGSENGIWQAKLGAIPIKTVHFEYDYYLSGNVPNSSAGGKLTLKKVWFEYGGKLTSKISPYIFDYKYFIPSYPAPYNTGDINQYGSGLNQNPSYAVSNSDRWGNYRDYSELIGKLGDLAKFWPYVNQNVNKNILPIDTYDPAAMCLKRIILPSGGELHIQYEQGDYNYVQDKKAMLMIPLKISTNPNESSGFVDNKKYFIDIEKIGIANDYFSNLSTAEKQIFVKEVFEPMIKNKDRIFFNFLYKLIGDGAPDYKYNHSDYVEGYARIDWIGYDDNGVFFTFKGSPESTTGTTWSMPINYGSNASKREVPREVCYDFYKTQRNGMLDGTTTGLDNNNENDGGESLAKSFFALISGISGIGPVCKEFDPTKSYVRIQDPIREVKTSRTRNGKLGVGVRVKRLLMYDTGIEGTTNNDPDVLYGQEFSYVNEDGLSSGVATNEPGNGRRESALVNVIEKDAQTGGEALLYGRDMYSQEGPLGENLLPAPSVGYSRVVVKNIHSGKTATGHEVHEYHTVKDFPFTAQKSTLDIAQFGPFSIGVSFGGFSVSYKREAPSLSQGYVFKSYSMHGQPKKVTKYASGLSGSPIASEEYQYFDLNESVALMGDDNIMLPPVPAYQLGKESEILSEAKEVTDYTFGGSIGVDVSWGGFVLAAPPLPPLPVPVPVSTSIKGGLSLEENIYRTHVTSKIITYPSLLKKVISKSEGVVHITENIVFDNHTGEPVVVKSYDDFNNNSVNFKGTYVNQDFMGSWNYKNLRSKFQNEGLNFTVNNLPVGNDGRDYIDFSGEPSSCGALGNFVRGDFVRFVNTGEAVFLYHVDEVDLVNNRLYILKSQVNTTNIAGTIKSLEIIKSGYTNQLSTKVGNIMFFSPNSTPSPFSSSGVLDDSHPFVVALNTQLGPLTGVGTTGTTTLVGPFMNMNITQYSLSMPTSCFGNDLTQTTIDNVVVEWEILPGEQLKLTILSFDALCFSGYVNIDCHPLSADL